ncbi:MAG TPA: class I SAM-dependent methyltransferase [Streptosporangiaceae bacterium]|nr:class I SAM-dependent methyltransferase [Streptosporangiaceae bacterium]
MNKAPSRPHAIWVPGNVTKIAGKPYEIITALSMTLGRAPRARAVAESARLTRSDRVVDIGCGPGTAVRHAALLGAAATGIDPDDVMLRLAGWITAVRRRPGVSWVKGRAEKLPLPAEQATVAWAISSVHHWADRAAGLCEVWRVLAPGGRVLLAERLTRPGARGHAAHGLTRDQAEELAAQVAATGFSRVRLEIRQAGRRHLVMIRGEKATTA